MSALCNLSALATRGLVFGACQAIGLEAGDRAVEPVTRFLSERFVRHGQRLLAALEKANERAWDGLEFALAGESLWQRCTAVFSRAEDRSFRDQVRLFLDSLPAHLLDAEGPQFRQQALAELQLARREGALRVSTLDVRQLAHHAGQLARFASPEALLAAERQALADIADSFPGERYARLRRLLTLVPPGGQPLLAALVRYFFRREIETDRQLFQGLAFALLEQQTDLLEGGLRHLEGLLDRHASRLSELIGGALEQSARTHDEIVKLSARLDQLLARHQLAGRELRPDDTLLTVSEDERRLVRELVHAYRSLPEPQRAARLELAFKVGQVEALTGEFTEAQKDFETAARLATEPGLRAEAHASASQAALARGDLDAALASLLDAAQHDSGRFAPFPLDKYRPERILGAGGFGVAFLCRHSFRRHAVVVKSLWTTGLDRPMDEVFNEAQVLAGLSHPAIIPVLDCDYADRERRLRPYTVMEYFEGLSLAAHVEKHGPLSPEKFLDIARQVALALRAAHDHGVYHRDIKPANILVRPTEGPSGDYDVRLIDFGLALRPARLASTRLAGEYTRQTLVGSSIAGTYKYAAPEQLGELSGVAIGSYSDVYAFGKTCYFALLGTPEPDDEEKEQLPEGWRRLLSRCTARVPARRYQNFAEVAGDLDRLSGPVLLDALPALELVPPARTPGTPPRRPRRPRRPASGQSSPSQVRATCVRPVQAHDGTVSVVAFRPDGRLLASGGFDDRVRLWSLPSGQMLLNLDAHAADVNGLAFRPDGGMLATAGDDREVRLWHVPSGRLSGVLRHPERVYAVTFSPDGKLLATGCDDGKIRLWPATAAGAPSQVLTGHTSFVRHLAFTPDGRTLVSASGDRLACLWNLPDGKRRTMLVGHSHTVWGVACSPDGRYIATASQDRTARVWLASNGQPLLTLEGHDEIVWCVSFSPDGRLVATASHDRTVRLWNALDGRLLTTLSGHSGLVRALAFSPDGRSLATASGDGMVRLWHLHDDAEHCDWSAGVPDLPPRPRVTLIRAGNGVVYPGDELWVDITVENTGRGDLVQLRASVESEEPLLRGLHTMFGRIRPGEKMSRCLSVLLPAKQPAGDLRGDLVFHEGNEYQPASVPVDFVVRPLPRDDFHVRWRLVDDGTGNSFGDGDGRPQRGECLDVVATVENQTGQELDGLHLTLTALEVPSGVVVNVGKAELPPLTDGGRVEGRVTFSVKPAARTGSATFELRVEAGDGRLFARVLVETEIE